MATVEDIFLAALEKPPTERAAYLADACGGDAELQAQVDALLRSHEQAGSILEQPLFQPGPTIDQPVPAERAGTVIGPYKLIEPIGEGGMGTVWMAQQTEPVKRLVAVKLIKAGMDSKQVIARFDAERQALALMDHPNIAKVLDAGTSDAGRPYFVMDLVKGVPITRYCDEHRLTPRQRLELFVPVCQAVQHAHQKGIIHRDLKPSNVLVALYDGKPVPKVIDFGVAKAAGQQLTDKTLVTGFGNIVGTPEYMSPEQAEVNQLDIDTRSDIYSLGVLLYELLAGSPPFTRKDLETAGMLEMLRVIREQEPSKPSTKLSTAEGLPTLAANRGTEPAKLTKLVRGELDWIVMKALEKDRGRRYETANGFAMDVQRYLADEAVLACPPSAGYRLRKFVRRNKRALATSTVMGVMLLVAVGVVAGSFGWVARDRAARKARVTGQIQLVLDDVARLEQELKWPEALDVARRAADLLPSSEVDAEITELVRDTLRDLELVRLLEDIRASRSEWKEDGFDFRGAAERYGAAFRDYGIDLDRLTADEAAQRVRSHSLVLAALIPALDDWANCRNKRVLGDRRGALHVWHVAELVDPDPWRQKVRQANRKGDVKAMLALAASPELAGQVAATLTDLSETLHHAGQLDVAIGVLSLAQREHPTDFWVHFWLAAAFAAKNPPSPEQAAGGYRAALALRPRSSAAWNNLGHALRAQEKLGEAIACFRRAVELAPKNANAHLNLGLGLQAQKKLDEAVAKFKEAIRLKPAFPEAHGSLGVLLCDDKHDYDAAIAAFREALRLNPSDAMAHKNLGAALRGKGKPDEAIAEYKEAIRLKPDYAKAHTGLGAVLCDDKRDYDAAIVAFRDALRLEPDYPVAHFGLGNALRKLGKLEEAIAEYKEAIRLNPTYAGAHDNLGALLCDDKREYDGAIVAFREALRLQPTDAAAHSNLGNALMAKGKTDEAIAAYQEAIRLNPALPSAHSGLGKALHSKGKPDDAIAAYREAIRLKPGYPEVHYSLGIALKAKGKLDEAVAAYREVIRLKPAHKGAYLNLGAILCDHKRDYDGAIAAFREAIRLEPNNPESHYNLGHALRHTGKTDEAIAAYKEAIRLKPSHGAAYENLGVILVVEKRDYDSAIAAFREAVRLRPDSPTAHGNLGLALRQTGKYDEAIAVYREALRVRPEDANACSSLAWLLTNHSVIRLRNPVQAVELAERAVKLKSQDYSCWHALGVVYYRTSRWQEAINALEKSCRLEAATNGKGNAWQWLFLAMVHWKLGHKDEALSWYDKAVKLETSWPQELGRFEAEAAELLGVPAAKRPKMEEKAK